MFNYTRSNPIRVQGLGFRSPLAVVYVHVTPPGQRYPVGLRTYEAGTEKELVQALRLVTRNNSVAVSRALHELKRTGRATSNTYGFMVQYTKFRPSAASR